MKIAANPPVAAPKSTVAPSVPIQPMGASAPVPVPFSASVPEPVGLYQYPNPPLSNPPSFHDESSRPGSGARVTLPALHSSQTAPRDYNRNVVTPPQVIPDQSHSVQAVPYHAPPDFSSLSMQSPRQDNVSMQSSIIRV